MVAFLLLVGSGLQIAQRARSDFSRLVATGLTIIIGFQAFFIMAGVLRLLPLTGITLPFVAYGGSSLVANYVLIALLLRVSDEGAVTADERSSGVAQPGERAFVRAELRGRDGAPDGHRTGRHRPGRWAPLLRRGHGAPPLTPTRWPRPPRCC